MAASFQPLNDLPPEQQWPHLVAETKLTLALVRAAPSFPVAGDDEAKLKWAGQVSAPLRQLLKCPDFVVNRGHYFGTAEFNDTANLSDDEKAFGTEPVLGDHDKRALIEFLKTF